MNPYFGYAIHFFYSWNGIFYTVKSTRRKLVENVIILAEQNELYYALTSFFNLNLNYSFLISLFNYKRKLLFSMVVIYIKIWISRMVGWLDSYRIFVIYITKYISCMWMLLSVLRNRKLFSQMIDVCGLLGNLSSNYVCFLSLSFSFFFGQEVTSLCGLLFSFISFMFSWENGTIKVFLRQ